MEFVYYQRIRPAIRQLDLSMMRTHHQPHPARKVQRTGTPKL